MKLSVESVPAFLKREKSDNNADEEKPLFWVYLWLWGYAESPCLADATDCPPTPS